MRTPAPVLLVLAWNLSYLGAQQPPAPPPDPFAAAPAPAPPLPPLIDMGQALEVLDQGRAASLKDVPFEGLLEFHKAAEGKTYASITLGYKTDEISRLAGADARPQLFALLRSTAPEGKRYDFILDTDFADSGAGAPAGMRVMQTGSAVEPGPYRLSMGVWIPGRNLAGGRAEEVSVPNFNGVALDLSSITLAAAVERAAGASAELKYPFIWGNFKVVPQLGGALKRPQPLRLYYQIYNASADPASGKPRLDLTYTFFQKKSGKYVQAAPPQPISNQSQQVAIYELPLDAWPAGEFKVMVQVRDAVSKTTASRELFFELR